MSAVTEHQWIDMALGVKRRTLASGETMLQMLVTLEAGSHLPEHEHHHEQIVHVVACRLRIVVAGVPHEVGSGESFYLTASTPHAVAAIETTLVLDTFSPPREDLLAQDRAVAGPA